jgi:GT2 family glycosyltransferase
MSNTRTEPLASVVVINHNSKDFLRQCLASVLTLKWRRLQVIVVDNASSDGSSEMVAAEFGDRVRLIRRKNNSPTAGRNEGFNVAKGEYILSLDNDIILKDRAVVQKAIDLFSRFPGVAALAFKVGDIEQPEEPLPEHWWHPVPVNQGKARFFLTDFFSEGAIFFRADVLKAAGGYDEHFFQYYEGNDLTLRLLRDGYDVLFCPTLCCSELRVRGAYHKKRHRVNYLSVRNKIWLAWKHYPFWRSVRYLLGRIAVSGARSLRHGWPDLFLRAVCRGVFAPKQIRCQRNPLNRNVWQRIRSIHTGIFVDEK